MCTVKLFIKKEDNCIIQRNVELTNISINPIDRPAYVVSIKQGDRIAFSFSYTNDSEKCSSFSGPNYLIEYGINSGRFYNVIVNKEGFNQTDEFQIVKGVIPNIQTIRFDDNIKIFIKVVNQLLKSQES